MTFHWIWFLCFFTGNEVLVSGVVRQNEAFQYAANTGLTGSRPLVTSSQSQSQLLGSGHKNSTIVAVNEIRKLVKPNPNLIQRIQILDQAITQLARLKHGEKCEPFRQELIDFFQSNSTPTSKIFPLIISLQMEILQDPTPLCNYSSHLICSRESWFCVCKDGLVPASSSTNNSSLCVLPFGAKCSTDGFPQYFPKDNYTFWNTTMLRIQPRPICYTGLECIQRKMNKKCWCPKLPKENGPIHISCRQKAIEKLNIIAPSIENVATTTQSIKPRIDFLSFQIAYDLLLEMGKHRSIPKSAVCDLRDNKLFNRLAMMYSSADLNLQFPKRNVNVKHVSLLRYLMISGNRFCDLWKHLICKDLSQMCDCPENLYWNSRTLDCELEEGQQCQPIPNKPFSLSSTNIRNSLTRHFYIPNPKCSRGLKCTINHIKWSHRCSYQQNNIRKQVSTKFKKLL